MVNMFTLGRRPRHASSVAPPMEGKKEMRRVRWMSNAGPALLSLAPLPPFARVYFGRLVRPFVGASLEIPLSLSKRMASQEKGDPRGVVAGREPGAEPTERVRRGPPGREALREEPREPAGAVGARPARPATPFWMPRVP